MYPNQYQPSAPRPTGVNRKLMFLIIGGVLALIIGVGLIVMSSGDKSGTVMARVVARHNALLLLVNESQKMIISGDLMKINTDASLFLTSDAAILTASLQQFGIKAVPKEVAAAEADAMTIERLAQADSAGRFDEAYKTALSQKIDEHQALLTEAQGRVAKPAAKAAIKSTYEHLENVQQQLKALPL